MGRNFLLSLLFYSDLWRIGWGPPTRGGQLALLSLQSPMLPQLETPSQAYQNNAQWHRWVSHHPTQGTFQSSYRAGVLILLRLSHDDVSGAFSWGYHAQALTSVSGASSNCCLLDASDGLSPLCILVWFSSFYPIRSRTGHRVCDERAATMWCCLGIYSRSTLFSKGPHI